MHDRIPLTRRQVLKGALGAAAIGAAEARATTRAPPGHRRVAIIGSGAGGATAAYLLSGSFAVDVFEERSRIGGHCDSRDVTYGGRRVTVDLGAQFFHPDTHPIYVTLLEELGLYDPDAPDGDETLQAPGSLCIFPTAGGAPVFSSSNPFATPFRSIQFAIFTQLARQAVVPGIAWEITVDEWIRGLPLRRPFKDRVLRPWITATIGCASADAMRASARSILQTFALAFPADVFQGATTYTSRIGMQGNLQRMLDRAATARVHLSTPVQAVRRSRAGWFVDTPAGRRGPYRFVVMAAPPLAARELLRPLPGFGDVTALLDAYQYFDSRLLVHADPAYVHADRSSWAAYNAGVDGVECEGSAWLGALHDPLPSGATVDVFKSWAQRRRADPEQVLFERRFKHPLITRTTIEAARMLRPHQGRHGLYFSGHFTTGMDLQESAVYSAIQVAEALAPASRNLASLNARLLTRGRTGISYDL